MDIQTIEATYWLVYRQDYHGSKFLVHYGVETEEGAGSTSPKPFPTRK